MEISALVGRSGAGSEGGMSPELLLAIATLCLSPAYPDLQRQCNAEILRCAAGTPTADKVIRCILEKELRK